MLKFIGLFFVLLIFFCLAVALGCVYGLATWFVVRHQRRFRLLLMIVGALIPLTSAIYVLGCDAALAIVIPGQADAFFGDISEPLPNGYRLFAMSDMPEYADIKSDSEKIPQPELHGDIAKVEVTGPLVVGSYSHHYSRLKTTAEENQAYFTFNTKTHEVREFPSMLELSSYVGHPIQLVAAQQFQSHEDSQWILVVAKRILWLLPPLVVTFLYFFFLIRYRGTDQVALWLLDRHSLSRRFYYAGIRAD